MRFDATINALERLAAAGAGAVPAKMEDLAPVLAELAAIEDLDFNPADPRDLAEGWIETICSGLVGPFWDDAAVDTATALVAVIAERAAIVAFLRNYRAVSFVGHAVLQGVADDIERGEHHKAEETAS